MDKDLSIVFLKCPLIGDTDLLLDKIAGANFALKIFKNNIMKEKKLIGQLIEEEVRRQMSITEFAEKIMCGRKNVYKIFEKSTIHLDQLARISKVLNRNFFKELAVNPSLIDIDSEEAIQEMENRRAISQFMEVVPKVLSGLGKQPIIAFGIPLGMEDIEELPDFMLTEYGICFSKGNYMAEKAQYATNPIFVFKPYESAEGVKVYLMTNTLFGTKMIDVKLDFKSEEEWEKTLRFIFETFFDHESN